MQPRYSPSGTEIAFTSDRGGGDNIWVMNRDGSGARAITKETFRLLNGPDWTPDGNFIVARKHFTSRRSLGAERIRGIDDAIRRPRVDAASQHLRLELVVRRPGAQLLGPHVEPLHDDLAQLVPHPLDQHHRHHHSAHAGRWGLHGLR